MKIVLHPEGDLRKSIQRIAKNSKLSTHDVAMMLVQNGLIKFTGTLEKEMKRENKWYVKLLRRLRNDK